MKTVTTVDSRGFDVPVTIPDHIPDAQASVGIPMMRVDVDSIDWDEVKKHLNNLLVARGLYSLADIERNPAVFQNTLVAVLKHKVISLYRQSENNGKQETP